MQTGTVRKVDSVLEKLSRRAAGWAGSSSAFTAAACFLLVWAAAGPIFGFSVGWHVVVHTVTSITTFLMVFLIQRAQNKESRAIQLKLNEIIAAQEGASNRLMSAEELNEEELESLHNRYLELAAQLKARSTLRNASSVEEAGREPIEPNP